MNPTHPGPSPGPFEVDTQEHGEDVRVLSVKGELDLSTAPQLEEPLDAALTELDGGSILVNLSECEFIDSTGIALLVRAWQQVQADGAGRFAVCCAKKQVRRVLEISGVDSSIPLHEGLDAALAQLDGSPA